MELQPAVPPPYGLGRFGLDSRWTLGGSQAPAHSNAPHRMQSRQSSRLGVTPLPPFPPSRHGRLREILSLQADQTFPMVLSDSDGLPGNLAKAFQTDDGGRHAPSVEGVAARAAKRL